MTVMERANAVNLKQQPQQQQQMSNYNQQATQQQQHQQASEHHVSFSETMPPLPSSVENRRASVGSNKNNVNTSRKNSTSSSIRDNVPLIPALANASNLSLSSTSSNNSAANRINANANNRRQSGNSISIKITNDNLLIKRNVTPPADEKQTENNNDDDDDDDVDVHEEFNDQDTNNDRDEGEDTTSNSTSNESYPNNLKLMKKKPKEKKKFVRSAAQQQHHLVYQESEDLGDEQLEPASRPNVEYTKTNMNRAFDELFAAAETGNSSMSAIIEAKMAAEAVEAAADLKSPSPTDSTAYIKKGSISSSRNGSIRASRPKGLFSRTCQHDPSIDAELYSNLVEQETQQIRRRLSNHLGSPQQLTRSVSCKRPGSFKKMKSKNASPNRNVNSTNVIQAKNANSTNASTPSAENNSSTPTNVSVGGPRRGTQCSITIMEDIESKRQQSRAGSLPFENLIRPQTLAIPGTPDMDADGGSSSAATTDMMPPNAADVYRIRQFVTNKDSVINRGDSFKRSFKRSNQSLASNSIKKDTSRELPAIPANSNTLNLPEPKDGAYFMTNNKTSSSSINETSFTNMENSSSNFAIKLDPAMVNELAATPTSANGTVANIATAANNMLKIHGQESVQTYVVYVLGSSSVGKNALIKQFKTSEYRGIYDICPHQSTDEEIEEGVSVILDGLESKIQFISMDVDLIKPSSLFEITKDNDAFIIVYSISDKSSYNTALDLLKSIRTSENRIKPVILVGNKSDLVRKRSINRDDGANLALKYGCKFVETSVAINDKVDDLLAGILKQIRLNESLYRELALAPDEKQTSFIETKKKHVRNYSDAQLHDIIKKSNASTATATASTRQQQQQQQQPNRYLSFKSNTLTRRFFNKNRNKENLNFSDSEKSSSPYSRSTYGATGNSVVASTAGNNTFSFFHKIYSTIFKKRSNSTQLQSVENLFTLPVPVSLNKSRKN